MEWNSSTKLGSNNISANCARPSTKSCSSNELARSTIPPPANSFSPLSNPRDADLKCEVCSKPAYLQCSLCRVTYYCNVEHQKIDWIGIHERICSTLEWLRKPLGFISTEEERLKKMEKIKKVQTNLFEVTKNTGLKLLFGGKAEAAIPAALQCLKFSAEVYGMASVESVIPYLLLAEANIMLKRLEQAESNLAQAQWIMLKTQHECPDAIRSAVQRKLGLLFATKGEYQAALECLAQDIYYSSCAYGPSHIRTAGGYFQMAEVFYKLYSNEKELVCEHVEREVNKEADRCPQGMINPSAAQQIPGMDGCRPMPPALVLKDRNSCEEFALSLNSPLFLSRVYKKPSVLPKPAQKDQVADDLYARVVDIWANHLSSIIVTRIRKPAISGEFDEKKLGETDAAEAKKMLTTINRYRSQRAALDGAEFSTSAAGRPDPRARLLLALSMLFWLLNDKAKAKQYYEDATAAVKKADENRKLASELENLKNLFEQ
ncbi:Zinc finger MYND domain containing protein 12 [Echinococcus multilocularis]|uniref:Zinc finger MYND domain containing protein 12 n=1 Tax=Echinococcus multilocularis TaxID=6211 RepID=A0A068YAP0_ECHMU|nr:Zinc finger MYND domain containing protein 12 [Echinococcus multilocularis]